MESAKNRATVASRQQQQQQQQQRRNISIARWYGRLGNNIQQVANAFYAGEQLNASVYVPATPPTASFLVSLGGRHHAPPHLIRPKHEATATAAAAIPHPSMNFFFGRDLKANGIEPPTREQFRALLLDRVAPLLNPPAPPADLDLNRALVAHVRSGDIFNPKNREPHDEYWQPPLAWYVRVGAAHRREHGADAPLVVVTEPDMHNPVIRALRERGWRIQSKTVNEDFGLIMQAKHVACSYGTFAMMAVLLSKTVRTVHVPLWDKPTTHGLAHWHGQPGNVAVHHYRLLNYAGEKWRNNTEQLALMIDYPQANIIAIENVQQ